ncbi:MAG: prenyltransferase/squalene oxidase repeat-containing protein [Candidatus Gastranaerophilaceae bacterium]|jgi:hypothetical protein
MYRRYRPIVSYILILFALLTAVFSTSIANAAKDYSSSEILAIARDLVNWKKADNGSSPDGYLMNSRYLQLAGSTAGDWYQIGMSRLGMPDNYSGYLAVIKEAVQDRYKTPNKLDRIKATEWHRISLSILACGGDPTNFGVDPNGDAINLTADGTYNRGFTASLGRQGINGWIWGLIALDAKHYSIPDGSYYSRADIIKEILKLQLSDGGFALTGRSADPDITAMAIQSLAPYYKSGSSYTYALTRQNGQTVTKTVKQAVNEALSCLSDMQLDTGDYISWGTQNVESTAQVLIALCCLGINPQADNRFIKNGNTLVDGIMRYRLSNGAFTHSFNNDPNNPGAQPGKPNSMAGEQVLLSLAALYRQMNGKPTLYDFGSYSDGGSSGGTGTPKLTPSPTNAPPINNLKTPEPNAGQTLAPDDGRLPNPTREPSVFFEQGNESVNQHGLFNGGGQSEGSSLDPVLLSFSATDMQAVNALPKSLTTEHYVDVITLLYKLENCEHFEGMDEYIRKLQSAKAAILDIQAEIDSLNADILEYMYPFEDITLKNKVTVDQIVLRYEALSEYDRAQIDRYEDVIKTKTKLDNQVRAIAIGCVLLLVGAGAAVLVGLNIKKRRNKRGNEMTELAAIYKDE